MCVATSGPEIAAKPWLKRSLYSQMKTVQLDDPREAVAYLRHRAALLEILNNADAYVTINGDPGSYPGQSPRNSPRFCCTTGEPSTGWARIRSPKRSFLGFGPAGASRNWGEPIAPYTAPTLTALKQQMQEPWELLPARGIGPQGINIELAYTKPACSAARRCSSTTPSSVNRRHRGRNFSLTPFGIR